MRGSRWMLLGSGALGLGVTLVTAALLPERVPIHFTDAATNTGASPGDYWVVWGVSFVALTGIAVGVPAYARTAPPNQVVMSNRAYWSTEERFEGAMVRLAAWYEGLGTGYNLGFTMIVLLGFGPAMRGSQGLDPTAFVVLLGLGAFTLVWVVSLFQLFRVPLDAE